jgi:tRNA pseudouridine38-40 synthase
MPTVQGTLAATIRSVTGETVLPQGAGRTDAGVHALAQVASFTLAVDIPAPNLHRALNRALPPSIRILKTEAVGEAFHARFSARGKTYEYRIHERREFVPVPHQLDPTRRDADSERWCSPFLAPYVWDCHWPLSLESMAVAAAAFIGTHDFTSFAASDPDLHRRGNASPFNPVKTITSSTLLRQNDLLLYRVTGSGFLHHMVRNIVGTLVDIGRGAMPPEAVAAILARRYRSAAGPTAPAQGLFLSSVHYE